MAIILPVDHCISLLQSLRVLFCWDEITTNFIYLFIHPFERENLSAVTIFEEGPGKH